MKNTEILTIYGKQTGIDFLGDICQRYVGWEEWENLDNKGRRAIYDELNNMPAIKLIELWAKWYGMWDNVSLAFNLYDKLNQR